MSKKENTIQTHKFDEIKQIKKEYLLLNRTNYTNLYNPNWVFNYYDIDTNVFKKICSEWDGWEDQLYTTNGVTVNKSKKNKIILYYNEENYSSAFYFIYSCLYPFYYCENLNGYSCYIDLNNIEDFVDLANEIKKRKKIEILLNNETYETLKTIKLTID